MGIPSDDILRKEYISFVEKFLVDMAAHEATEVHFKKEDDGVGAYELVDGILNKGTEINAGSFEIFKRVLNDHLFADGPYKVNLKEYMCVFNLEEEFDGTLKLVIIRRPIKNGSNYNLDDVFSVYEHPTWDAIKSIFLSIINLALAQEYDRIVMHLDGPVVDIMYERKGERMPGMTISSDSYDALVRLIGDNYLAFGFMTKHFKDAEYLIRLRELDEYQVAPKIILEIETLV